MFTINKSIKKTIKLNKNVYNFISYTKQLKLFKGNYSSEPE